MTPFDFSALAAHVRTASRTRRAVVIGGSLAGLLAARVLAEHFNEVIILDRDALPDGNTHRKATPQTQHAHGLLARGRDVLEQLFPGITDEWVAHGGSLGDIQSQLGFYGGGLRFAQRECGVRAVAVGRAVIEGAVRRRVLALPGVRACTGVDVRRLTADAAARVTGVELAGVDGDATLALPAELVVDASGRASRLPQWLESLGHEAPAEQRVKVDIRYATAYLEREPDHAPGLEVVLCTPNNAKPEIGVMIAQEGGRWVVTLGGYASDAPPLTHDAFVQRAQAMGSELAATVRSARFVAEPIGYRFPHSQRRRYERLRRFPDGLLAIGDAICSFNPIYGQGMSVAACEALALGECLRAGEAKLAQRFFKRAARIVDVAWDTAVGADLAMDVVEGERSAAVKLINGYIAKVFRAAQHDAVVAFAFLRVAHLLAQPPSLMRPTIMARVFWALWRHRDSANAVASGRPATAG